VVSGISGGPQAVNGIGWAPPDPIHWPKCGRAQERENRLFEWVISVHISHPKWLSAVGSEITQINGGIVTTIKGQT